MNTEAKSPDTPAAATTPEVSDPRIYLALPAYGKVDVPFVISLLSLLQATQNVIGQVEFMQGDSLVNRARNNLAHLFMSGRPHPDGKGGTHNVKYDWLLFIDTDLAFQPQDITALYELAKKRGPGIYAGTYPIKTLKPKIVFNSLPGATVDAEGVIEVRETGTGFMLIHRQVFEKIRDKFRDEIEFVADTGDMTKEPVKKCDFFRVGVRRDMDFGYKRFLSEDWFFCQLWRELGGKILLHTKLQANHIGTIAYPVNPAELLEAAEVYRQAIERQTGKKVDVASAA